MERIGDEAKPTAYVARLVETGEDQTNNLGPDYVDIDMSGVEFYNQCCTLLEATEALSTGRGMDI